MTKKEYAVLLLSDKWINKRSKILRRDNYACRHCNSKDNLHVHHLYYLPDKKPWEVPDNALKTLCATCHNNEHKGRNIMSFVIKKEKQNKLSKKDKIKKRINYMYAGLSAKDKELQKKYDKLKSCR